MAQVLPLVQIGLSLLVIVGVLLQRSEAGLGSAFGGESMSGHFARRGFERTLFIATIIAGFLFVVSTFLSLILSR